MIDTESIAKNITLSDGLNEYLALRQIDKRKYYPMYLISAKHTWKEMFEGTIYVMTSVWKTVKAGDPYPYVDVPKDAQRIFSVGREDHCGDIKTLYYNNRMNIIPKPTEKKCGCSDCDCGGMCEEVNSTILTTKEIFTISGVTYYEKLYLKYCSNGDMIEYKETPVKQYNDFKGDGGDFNSDYGSDYSGGSSAFPNFTVVTNITQRKICSLQTKPCGCPVDSPENEHILLESCGCFLPFFGRHRKHHCDKFLADTNTSEYGSVKISECGSKIYFQPGHKDHHHHHRDHKRIPDFLLVIYQTGGEPKNITEQVMIPDVAAYKNCLWTGIDWQSKRFNNKYPANEKQLAKYQYNDASNSLVGYLNPLNMEDLADLQDLPHKW